MGACAFVASGLRFDVDGYLTGSPFRPVKVFRKGEVPAKETSARPDSGFVVVVREGSLAEILDAAMTFLTRHEPDLRAMRKLGVDNVLFDFGVERTWELQEAHYFPAALIARMGQLGLGMIFSSIQLPRG